MGTWLVWTHGYATPKVLEVRKGIAAQLEDFRADGDLTLGSMSDNIVAIGDIAARLLAAELLPAKDAVGFDPNNISALIAELERRQITDAMRRRLLQGPALTPAINGLPVMMSEGRLKHSGSALMNWCVGNAKVEDRGNGRMITKQAAGRAKIDPLIALLCAGTVMSWNPIAFRKPSSPWDDPNYRYVA
jgi:phage terminase large subunit-like protein